jgi:hypothetical protein
VLCTFVTGHVGCRGLCVGVLGGFFFFFFFFVVFFFGFGFLVCGLGADCVIAESISNKNSSAVSSWHFIST